MAKIYNTDTLTEVLELAMPKLSVATQRADASDLVALVIPEVVHQRKGTPECGEVVRTGYALKNGKANIFFRLDEKVITNLAERDAYNAQGRKGLRGQSAAPGMAATRMDTKRELEQRFNPRCGDYMDAMKDLLAKLRIPYTYEKNMFTFDVAPMNRFLDTVEKGWTLKRTLNSLQGNTLQAIVKQGPKGPARLDRGDSERER